MSQQQPQLKYSYFDFAGRGELTRLVMTMGGLQFEDNRLSGDAFAAAKPTLPLGQLPVLQVNGGTTYAQSMALVRYTGRLSGLYPTDPLDALKVDMLTDTLVDAFNTFVDIKWMTPDETVKADKTTKFVNETLPQIFGLLEKNASTGKFFLGANKPSIADVFVFDYFTNVIQTTFPAFKTDSFPHVTAIIASVAADPKIVAYLAKNKK